MGPPNDPQDQLLTTLPTCTKYAKSSVYLIPTTAIAEKANKCWAVDTHDELIVNYNSSMINRSVAMDKSKNEYASQFGTAQNTKEKDCMPVAIQQIKSD